MLQQTTNHICYYWSQTTSIFHIPSVKIKQLAEQSKPSKADKAYATKIIHEMVD
jgi:hypothetical protein